MKFKYDLSGFAFKCMNLAYGIYFNKKILKKYKNKKNHGFIFYMIMIMIMLLLFLFLMLIVVGLITGFINSDKANDEKFLEIFSNIFEPCGSMRCKRPKAARGNADFLGRVRLEGKTKVS